MSYGGMKHPDDWDAIEAARNQVAQKDIANMYRKKWHDIQSSRDKWQAAAIVMALCLVASLAFHIF